MKENRFLKMILKYYVKKHEKYCHKKIMFSLLELLLLSVEIFTDNFTISKNYLESVEKFLILIIYF